MAFSMGIGRRDWAPLAVGLMVAMSFLVLGDGREFMVGGKNGWTQPNPTNATAPYNEWAERNRFQVGDTLLFVYRAKEDLVLRVSEEDYRRCDGSKPIASYDDGRTVIKLERSGAHYFISGIEERCRNSERLIVVVLALRGAESRSVPVAAPAPLQGATGVVQGSLPTSAAHRHIAVLQRSAVYVGFMALCMVLL